MVYSVCFLSNHQMLGQVGKDMYLVCGKLYNKMEIWWKKSTNTLGKKWVSISHALPIWWILLHFLMLWKIDGETHSNRNTRNTRNTRPPPPTPQKKKKILIFRKIELYSWNIKKIFPYIFPKEICSYISEYGII